MKSQPVPPHQMSDSPGMLTALSRSTRRLCRKFRHLSPVARTSLRLGLIAALGGLSCLVTTSPDFTKPNRTPPFLTDITPPTWQVRRLESLAGSPGTYPNYPIGANVESEDLQSAPLQGILFVDFEGFLTPYKILPTLTQPIKPGHLPDSPNDPKRETIRATATFPPNITPGCHSITLAVSHEFKQDLGTQIIAPVEDGDVATVTWWYDLVDSTAPPTTLSACVVRPVATGDAGPDADAQTQDAGAP
jgi:hypothetical protein